MTINELRAETTSHTSFTLAFEMVKARLREAGSTVKRMRLEKWDYPSQRLAWWPDVVRQAADSYGYQEARGTLAAADPGAIDRMEEVLRWVMWLDDEGKKLVWARASGATWRHLEDIDGRSRVTLRKAYDKALEEIVGRLSEEGTR